MGSRTTGLAITVFLLAVFSFVFIAGTTPVDQALWLTLVYNVGGVVVFLGLALAWYQRYIKLLATSDPEAARAELRASAAAGASGSGASGSASASASAEDGQKAGEAGEAQKTGEADEAAGAEVGDMAEAEASDVTEAEGVGAAAE